MTDILDQDFRSSPDTFANGVGDETVLLQVKHGIYYGLDPIGTQIWAGLGEGEGLRAICDRIARDYAVPLDTVEADARKFMEDLKENEIVLAA